MIWHTFFQPFIEFGFMRRALVVCLALSLSTTMLGVFLLLRRMSLMGDALSHAILPGVAVGYLLSGMSLLAMTVGGFVAGIAVALVAGWVSRRTPLKEDASFAGFYLGSLALGVTLVSLRGSSVDLLHLLFGSILAVDRDAALFVSGVASLTLLCIALCYRGLLTKPSHRDSGVAMKNMIGTGNALERLKNSFGVQPKFGSVDEWRAGKPKKAVSAARNWKNKTSAHVQRKSLDVLEFRICTAAIR